MPANARQQERYWTEPPDDEPEQTCPRCDGRGWITTLYVANREIFDGDENECPVCHTAGSIPYEPDPDRDYDAMVDRMMER